MKKKKNWAIQKMMPQMMMMEVTLPKKVVSEEMLLEVKVK